MKKLSDLRTGDWIRWDSRDWEVTDRDVYRESADYSEVQWELSPERGGEYYLVMSRERKDSSEEEVWVCTSRTGIGGVEHNAEEGRWRPFEEKDSLSGPPSACRYDGQNFAFQGQTRADAEDDDGNTVPRLTWDYYDQSRRRNLAIEVWSEPDADYYEAYDGRVVKPEEFQFLPPRPRRGVKMDQLAGSLAAAAFGALFVVPVAAGILGAFDVGGEYLLAALVPAAFIFISVLRGAHRGLLAAALPAACAAGWLAVKFRGTGASYWEYALYGLAAGPVITEAAFRFFPDAGYRDKPAAAGNASLLFLLVIGFAHYIGFAPRPHNMSGLLAACALPLPPALAAYLVYRLKGEPDGTPQA